MLQERIRRLATAVTVATLAVALVPGLVLGHAELETPTPADKSVVTEPVAEVSGIYSEAMKPDGKLLIVEMVLPEGDEPHMGKMLDMMMMLVPGGEERTTSEYAELLEPNGFRIERVVPTSSAVSVVEAVRA